MELCWLATVLSGANRSLLWAVRGTCSTNAGCCCTTSGLFAEQRHCVSWAALGALSQSAAVEAGKGSDGRAGRHGQWPAVRTVPFVCSADRRWGGTGCTARPASAPRDAVQQSQPTPQSLSSDIDWLTSGKGSRHGAGPVAYPRRASRASATAVIGDEEFTYTTHTQTHTDSHTRRRPMRDKEGEGLGSAASTSHRAVDRAIDQLRAARTGQGREATDKLA